MPEKGYQFNKASVDRIGNAVRKVEGMPREPTRGSPPDRAPVPVAIIKLDAQVGPSTSTDLANGTGVLCYMNSAGDITESTQAVTAYNLAKAAATTEVYHRAQRDPLTGLWIIGDDNAGQVIRFQLSAAKTKSDLTVNGLKVGWGGAAYDTTGNTITLIDSVGAWTAPSTARGWAVKMSDRPDISGTDAYEIIYCESYARFIEFTLTSTFASNKATASLTTHWGDAPNGLQPSLSTVHDPLGIYSTMASGSKGHAVFNDATTQYVVFDMKITSDGIRYGKATKNWIGSGSTAPYVYVNPCSYDGSGIDSGSTLRIELLRTGLPASNNHIGDPNVTSGDILAFAEVNSTQGVCVSNYMDDKIGTVKMWLEGTGYIPKGWALMDGIDNATPNGSGYDLTGKFVVGVDSANSDWNTVASVGGSTSHTHLDSAGSQFSDASANRVLDEANHLPPYFALHFIERIDNSTV